MPKLEARIDDDLDGRIKEHLEKRYPGVTTSDMTRAFWELQLKFDIYAVKSLFEKSPRAIARILLQNDQRIMRVEAEKLALKQEIEHLRHEMEFLRDQSEEQNREKQKRIEGLVRECDRLRWKTGKTRTSGASWYNASDNRETTHKAMYWCFDCRAYIAPEKREAHLAATEGYGRKHLIDAEASMVNLR